MTPDYTSRYIALKALQPYAFRKALAFAAEVTLNNNLDPLVHADVESACILLACELLEVEP